MNTPPLTIAHVVPTLDPDYGGPPVVALQLAAAQAHLGHKVHMVSHEIPGIKDTIDKSLSTIPHADKIVYHRVPQIGKLEKLIGGNLSTALDSFVDEVDIYHLHGVWEPTIATAARFAYRNIKPYIVAPHGMLDPYGLAQKAFKKKVMLKLFYRKMLNRAAALHMLNADEKQLIEPLELQTDCLVIPNGVHLDEIDPLPEPGTFYKNHPELGNRPYFLFLSRLHHKKGLDFLINAYAQYLIDGGTYDLVIAGPDGGVLDLITEMREVHQLEKRIHLVGPQYAENKFAALQDATAFTLTSRQEGFSIAISEALACKLPVLITTNCHFPEVEQANAGYVIELEHTQIVEKLHALEKDPAGSQAMGANGRTLIETHFTWPKIAAQTIAHYTNIINYHNS